LIFFVYRYCLRQNKQQKAINNERETMKKEALSGINLAHKKKKLLHIHNLQFEQSFLLNLYLWSLFKTFA
jgi:hypothetical protein